MFVMIYSYLVVSFLISVIIAMPTINHLRKLKFGQKILEEGPKWHLNKQYTPTMGGFIFIIPTVLVSVLISTISEPSSILHYIAIPAFSLIFGIIGFVDDYTKVAKKQNLGLTALQKLALQIVASLVFVIGLRNIGMIVPNIYVPFIDMQIEIPWIIFLLFASFVVVGTTNAVNLTDGIDGLATSVTIPVCIFFIFTAAAQGNTHVLVFAMALLGGLIGFLIFNFNPAKVFMGDTGSLFLGGAVVSMALALNIPLILIPVGIIYIIEALSVILQVTYFKATKGKRLFKMAPIHHHFEMLGMSEKQLCFTFTLVTALMCIVAYKFGLGANY